MRKAFGQAIMAIGGAYSDFYVLNGDVEQEMDAFRAAWPTRILNLGTCEQSIISIAAGMACEGLRPLVYSITPFVLERPFEQIKIDIDEQNLPVILVGYSSYPKHGPTHTPLDPRKICACFKNVQAYFPETAEEAYRAITTALVRNRPAFINLKRAPA